MTRRSIIITASLVTIAGISTAGYLYYLKQKKLVKDYDVTLQGFKIISKTAALWVVDLTIRFFNTTDIQATIKKMYSDVYLNNIYVGFGTNKEATTVIPGRTIDPTTKQPQPGIADIIIELTFAPKDVFGNAVDIILGTLAKKDVPWRLKGYVDLSSSFVSSSVTFDVNGTLADFL